MPMYEYRCDECSYLYEQLRRMSDADRDLECPKCGSKRVERQVSAFAMNGGGGGAGACAPGGRFT
jgi:putative FmdB family regulatory protein